MPPFTLYDKLTGTILGYGEASEPIDQVQDESQDIIVGAAYSDVRYRIDPQSKAAIEITEISRAALIRAIVEERGRRLAMGFDYDFGDLRGVHHIGTSEQDMRGWDEVTQFAGAMLAAGQSAPIGIVTESGATFVTPIEWQSILIAAGAFRQPIWQASFLLQAMEPIPQDITNNTYWQGA